MFLQVYYHDLRRIYDIHLLGFLKEFLVGSRFSNDLDDYLELNDSVILAEICKTGWRKLECIVAEIE